MIPSIKDMSIIFNEMVSKSNVDYNNISNVTIQTQNGSNKTDFVTVKDDKGNSVTANGVNTSLTDDMARRGNNLERQRGRQYT
jgi:hypothetical protein